jgi:Family of unknown function (DUF5677)
MLFMDKSLARKVKRVLRAENRYLEACRQYLETLRPAVRAISENVQDDKLTRQLIYRCIAKRAEENFSTVTSTVETTHAFMGPLVLRPLCEDLIYGCWLARLPTSVADSFVELSAMDDMLKSLRAQTNFMPRAYAKYTFWSPSDVERFLGPEAERSEEFIGEQNAIIDIERNRVRSDLKAMGARLGWARGKVPSIYSMAKECNLEEIYELFYHGTSKAVHSDLHHMTQMVGRSSTGALNISSQRTKGHYSLFSLTYGMWLTEELFTRVIGPAFEYECSLIDDQARGVWLALVLTGLSRNRALPPLVTAAEEMGFLRSLM